MPKYASLHGHSDYSILDGCAHITKIVERASDIGLEHIALTDHGTMAGIFEFSKKTKDANIHGICGVEAYIVEDRLLQSPLKEEVGKLDKIEREVLVKERRKYNHVVLLAQNNIGLRNLFKIVSDSNVNGFYYRPRTDWKFLSEHSEGIIVLSGCLQGKLNKMILDNEPSEDIFLYINNMIDIFDNRFFLELQVNESDDQKRCNRKLIEIARSKNVPLVVTNDYHYVFSNEVEVHRMWKYIDFHKIKNNKTNLDFKDFKGYSTTGHFVVNYEDIKKIWLLNHSNLGIDVLNEACKNTMKIAESCEAYPKFGHQKIEFPLPKQFETKRQYLNALIRYGLEKRRKYLVRDEIDEYKSRLKYEIDILEKRNFLDYFFIVQDAIAWCKKNGIPTGCGRGSSSGSLVSYLIGITEVDPIRYNLSFERFLNPQLQKEPDIDIDVCSIGRERLLDHLKEKWGSASVASIATYHRFSSKSLFRDISSSLGLPFGEWNEAAKTIDAGISWKENVNSSEVLKTFLKKNKGISKYIEPLDGGIRNVSTHAAGVIITNDRIDNYVPLRRVKDNILVEPEGNSLKDLGILKMDFLGLDTLTVMNQTLESIGMTMSDLYSVPMDDDKVFEKFRQGDTVGVFQFDGSGMTDLAVKIGVRSIEDLAACNTMYRPAVLNAGVHEEYIKRRNGKSKVRFLYKAFKDVLEPTYGLIIYQEQINDILSIMGLDKGEADLMRRDMENLLKGESTKEDINKWIQKMKDRNYGGIFKDSKSTAPRIIKQLMDQVGYLFCLGHSISYSIIGYLCQWLKVYCPHEFILSLLNNESKNNKIENFIRSFQRYFSFDVKIGSINNFSHKFKWVKTKNNNKVLLYGLESAKGLGLGPLKSIIEDRKENGKYESFADFIFRNDFKGVNKKHISVLIDLGLFDNLPVIKDGIEVLNRKKLKRVFELYREESKKKRVDKKDIEKCFKLVLEKIRIKIFHSVSQQELIKKEREILGFNIAHDPLPYVLSKFSDPLCRHRIEQRLKNEPGNLNVFPGIISNIKLHEDKRKNQMAFLDIRTAEGKQSITVFANKWSSVKNELGEGSSGLFIVKPNSRGSLFHSFVPITPPDDYRG